MKKLLLILCLVFMPVMAQAADITVYYNPKGKIMNTHYNAPGSGSANVIITVDLLFEDGKYMKCIETYISGGALIGFGRITSPSTIEFVPRDGVKCISK